jgi:hypothetical protein
MFAALAIASLMTSCAAPSGPKQIVPNVSAPVVAPTVVSSACVWLHVFKPDKGFETRLTRREKEYLVALNRNIKKNCRD